MFGQLAKPGPRLLASSAKLSLIPNPLPHPTPNERKGQCSGEKEELSSATLGKQGKVILTKARRGAEFGLPGSGREVHILRKTWGIECS